MTVYIIRAIGVNRIKVGVTYDLPRRLLELQAGSPVPLEVIQTIEAGRETESTIHRMMFEHHCHNEWFVEDGGLEIALRWLAVMEGAAKSVAEAIVTYVPAKIHQQLIQTLIEADCALIADAVERLKQT